MSFWNDLNHFSKHVVDIDCDFAIAFAEKNLVTLNSNDNASNSFVAKIE